MKLDEILPKSLTYIRVSVIIEEILKFTFSFHKSRFDSFGNLVNLLTVSRFSTYFSNFETMELQIKHGKC